MPGVDFRQLRVLVSMRDVLDLLGWRPRARCGEQQWRGGCPLHGSQSATSCCFAVHVGKKVYHCFRCGASGNVLELYAAATGQPPYQAALELCGRLGHAVPWRRRSGQRKRGRTTMRGP
jgi:DNA primase